VVVCHESVVVVAAAAAAFADTVLIVNYGLDRASWHDHVDALGVAVVLGIDHCVVTVFVLVPARTGLTCLIVTTMASLKRHPDDPLLHDSTVAADAAVSCFAATRAAVLGASATHGVHAAVVAVAASKFDDPLVALYYVA